MKKTSIVELLDGKWEDGTRPKDLFADRVSKKPEAYVGEILSGLRAKSRKVQGGCAELASLMSEQRPDLLMPHCDVFVDNLGSKAPILRWEAVCTLGNLAAADQEGKVRAQLRPIAELLHEKSIVLQGHAARALAKIGRAFPDTAAWIVRSLIAARDEFPGNRVGFLVEAAGALVRDPKLRSEIHRFVAPYARAEEKSVAAKARRVLRSLEGESRRPGR